MQHPIPPQPHQSPRRWVGPLVGVLWLGAVGTGTAAVARYKSTPGASLPAPPSWPADASLSPAAERMTLLMFAHPMCPCTRASLAELNKLMQRVGDNVDAKVVFVIPAGAPAGWDSTKSWGIARAVPHTSVVADQDAALAKQFGATTSGDVLLYARDRTLLFHGGITGARGHEGDNAGEARILALARGEKAELATAPVFGCALDDPDNDGKAPK